MNILNEHAKALNKEAKDVLSYQEEKLEALNRVCRGIGFVTKK